MSLIDKLTEEHGAQPLWKRRKIFLSLWFGVNVLYFLLALLFQGLHFSHAPLLMNFLVFWFFFTHFLNSEEIEHKVPWAMFAGFLFLTILNLCLGLVTHNRTLGIESNDGTCFIHTVLTALIPIVITPFFLKHFFVPQAGWTLFFLTASITSLSLYLTELQCADRELWHLIFGHESTYIGVGVLGLVVFLLYKKIGKLA